MKLSLFVFLSCLLFTSSALKGYGTYHLYTPTTTLGELSCSDGANGLITRWNLSKICSLYPYVTAYSGAGWNSPNCGGCVKMTVTQNLKPKTIYVTVIDLCGTPPSPSYDAHFDMAPEAFEELFGSKDAGFGDLTWDWDTSNNCKGNQGK